MKDQENFEPSNTLKIKPTLSERVPSSQLKIDTSYPDEY